MHTKPSFVRQSRTSKGILRPGFQVGRARCARYRLALRSPELAKGEVWQEWIRTTEGVKPADLQGAPLHRRIQIPWPKSGQNPNLARLSSTFRRFFPAKEVRHVPARGSCRQDFWLNRAVFGCPKTARQIT